MCKRLPSNRIMILCLSLIAFGCAPSSPTSETSKNANLIEETQSFNERVVEASCGQCQFGLLGDGCNLAIRMDDQAYFVDGTDIDDHGDAHASDGLCNAIRRAKVSGHLENGRFVATSFELLPSEAATNGKH